MLHSPSSAVQPTPSSRHYPSPFSSYSVISDPTSDEQPDLGSWTSVFRALNYLPYKSTPGTPPRNHADKQSQRAAATAVEGDSGPRRSRSTPSLRIPLTIPAEPQTLQLRTLAHKLRLLFPEDAASLAAVLANDSPVSPAKVDASLPAPQPPDPLIHVFIDHSNILIGFLNYLRKHPLHTHHNKQRHMSHAALALILERGRRISRRVLVTSSPLYQPIESAEELGYEVRVYKRVPDVDPKHPQQPATSLAHPNGNNISINGNHVHGQGGKRHSRKPSGYASGELGEHTTGTTGVTTATSTTTASPTKQPPPPPVPAPAPPPTLIIPPPPPMRVRYREQGVDELLQLKLHQSIADVDAPAAGGCAATIVLATGDGNAGQFSEDGFLGPVRTALKKGWRVEKGRFSIVGLERFGADLLQV